MERVPHNINLGEAEMFTWVFHQVQMEHPVAIAPARQAFLQPFNLRCLPVLPAAWLALLHLAQVPREQAPDLVQRCSLAEPCGDSKTTSQYKDMNQVPNLPGAPT